MTLVAHRHYRILLIDSNKYDRELLSLSLRNHLQHVDILVASSALDFAEHLAAGAIDAVVTDVQIGWSSPFELVPAVRRQNAACAFCIFTNEHHLPSAVACIGNGIDANLEKNSAGFLQLPQILGRVFARHEELTRLTRNSQSAQSSAYVPLATCLISDSGAVNVVNAVFERILHTPRYRLAEQTVNELFPDAEDAAKWQRLTRSKHRYDSVVTLDVSMLTGNGTRIPVRIIARPLVIEGSSVRLWSAVLLDEDAIGTPIGVKPRGAEPSLQLGSMLSHDLQQPLQNILRQAQWLSDHDVESMSEEARNTVNHIHASAQRMQDMVDGAISLLRIDQASQNLGSVDLNVVTQEAIDNLRSLIESSAATIECDLMPTIAGNHGQLVQLFQNLLGNAMKFRGDRLPRIKITAAKQEMAWQIRVEDNGIGIKEQDRKRIFELYQRLHSDDEYPGTGVGLAICKRIMESHGGKISVESAVGRGTVFILELPVKTTTTV